MENEIYTTRDLSLAASLMTLKFYLDGIDFQLEGSGKLPVGYFNFEKTEDLMDAEKKYWTGKLALDPRAFMNNLKELKSRVNGEYKNPRATFGNS